MKDILKQYVIVTDLDKTIIKESPTYGDYNMRRVLTIKYLDSLNQGCFETIYDFYTDLRDKLPSSKLVILESNIIMNQKISNFDLYIALDEDNKDWKDPKNYLKKLPVSFSRKGIMKLVNNLIKKHSK